MDERQLQYVYGDALRPPAAWPWCWPTPASGNASPGRGIDWARCVLGEQRIATHRPLPAAGRIASQLRVTRITDKAGSSARCCTPSARCTTPTMARTTPRFPW